MTNRFQKTKLLIDHLNTQHGMSIKEEIINFSNVSGTNMT